VDWKPERVVQAKVRVFFQKKKHDCWGAPMEENSALVYKWRLLLDFWPTNGDFFQTFGQQWALPLGGIDRYLVPGLPRQWLDLFTITSSPRKFAECLYCDVTPPPILPVLSHFIEFTCHMQLCSRTVIQSYKSHSFIHSYNYTSIHQYFHMYIHNIYTISIHTSLH